MLIANALQTHDLCSCKTLHKGRTSLISIIHMITIVRCHYFASLRRWSPVVCGSGSDGNHPMANKSNHQNRISVLLTWFLLMRYLAPFGRIACCSCKKRIQIQHSHMWRTKRNEESLLCYLTVSKCHLPASTYAAPALTITRQDALLSSPTIQDI